MLPPTVARLKHSPGSSTGTPRWPYHRDPLPPALIEAIGGMSQGAARVVVHDDRKTIAALRHAE